MAGITPNQAGFAASVLKAIGAPATPANIAGFVGWSKAEGGDNWQRNNPLNTTESLGLTGSINSVGVKRYPTAQAGIAATVKTLQNGNYGGIVGALKSNNVHGLAGAIGSSPWGTSGSLAAQTIAQTLGQPVPSVGSVSPAAAATTAGAPQAVTQFDQAAFEKANRAAIAGKFLAQNAGGMSLFNTGPKSSVPAGASLFGPGLLTTVAPNRADYTTTHYATAQQNLQGLAGKTSLSAHPANEPAGVVTFGGKPVAKWIAPILAYAKQHGWTGSVNSGYRTLAQQTAIYNSGVRPAAVPGTSNHESDVFPGGAVDVSDAAQLSQILSRSPYASTLVWAGSKDPVHFSHPHNGSY